MRGKSNGLLLKVFLVGFTVYASYQIIELQVQIQEKKEAIAVYQQENATVQIQNQMTEDAIKKGLTDEAVEKIAREKLGLVSPEERIFVGISG